MKVSWISRPTAFLVAEDSMPDLSQLKAPTERVVELGGRESFADFAANCFGGIDHLVEANSTLRTQRPSELRLGDSERCRAEARAGWLRRSLSRFEVRSKRVDLKGQRQLRQSFEPSGRLLSRLARLADGITTGMET